MLLNGFQQNSNTIHNDRRLDPFHKTILNVLNGLYPTKTIDQFSLAILVNCGRTYINIKLKDLKKWGYVTWEPGVTKNLPNTYTLHLPCLIRCETFCKNCQRPFEVEQQKELTSILNSLH